MLTFAVIAVLEVKIKPVPTSDASSLTVIVLALIFAAVTALALSLSVVIAPSTISSAPAACCKKGSETVRVTPAVVAATSRPKELKLAPDGTGPVNPLKCVHVLAAKADP